jgi:arabinan endo-1,5-alpha-L-arabinosidase
MRRIILVFLGISLWISANAQSRQIIVHDPVAIESEGKYYMYSTGVGVASWWSDDLLHWNFLSQVFKDLPQWCKEEIPLFDGNIWAPDISYHQGKFFLYYSISSFKSNRSAIGVATNLSLDPENDKYEWIDHGIVVESVPGKDHYNCIDPNLIFDEEDQPWLTFGSFWGGMKLLKMDDNLLSPALPEEWKTIASRERTFGLDAEDPGDGRIEAPFIIKREDYYYLFVSFDLCCRGSRSTYNVRVGRSENITGSYLDKEGISMGKGGGSLIVKGDKDYYGIGHNSVYEFDGQYYMFSHGYDVHDDGKPKLVIHLLNWDKDGWPVIEQVD